MEGDWARDRPIGFIVGATPHLSQPGDRPVVRRDDLAMAFAARIRVDPCEWRDEVRICVVFDGESPPFLK
jgi:hypothetical protein